MDGPLLPAPGLLTLVWLCGCCVVWVCGCVGVVLYGCDCVLFVCARMCEFG